MNVHTVDCMSMQSVWMSGPFESCDSSVSSEVSDVAA
ncbi:MAG: hypothetical protein RLZ04_1261 [Actinomycetota bacterium]|jgi:hypothetical protein